MKFFSWWCVRLGLLLGCLGIYASTFIKGDGPNPNWSVAEQVFQSTGAALLTGSLGFCVGSLFDIAGLGFRRFRKFSSDMREQDRRLSEL